MVIDMKKKKAKKRFLMFFVIYLGIGIILLQNVGSSFIQIYNKNKEKPISCDENRSFSR